MSAELDGEAVLLNVESGVYFGLDAVGSEIWKHLEGGATEDEICARLLAEYDVEEAIVKRDVSDFLGLLRSKGLVRNADA